MSRFENTFRSAVANAERDVLIAQIRANPQMTLSELGKLTSGGLGPLLKGLTVGDLLQAAGAAITAEPVRPAAKPAKVAKTRGRRPASDVAPPKVSVVRPPVKSSPKTSAEVETRTATGRDHYDQSVLIAIRGFGKPMSAEELRSEVGGTPLQARASLARLINAGTVTWEGKARGTRYSLIEG